MLAGRKKRREGIKERGKEGREGERIEKRTGKLWRQGMVNEIDK